MKEPQTAPRSQDSEDIPPVLKQMHFVLIRPGTFQMGSENGDAHERPVRRRIRKAFYIGSCVVTQGEWKAIMHTEPWKGKDFVECDDSYPATYIGWEDTQKFISKLKSFDKKNSYRLPTEVEWEYAARAGTSTKFSFGDDEDLLNAYGWYKKNAFDAETRHPLKVRQKYPNPWGLYDVHGNVWEWVEDWYYGPYSEKPRQNPVEKVLRGGAYDFEADGARSAYRNKGSPIRPNHVIGFRLVKVSSSPDKVLIHVHPYASKNLILFIHGLGGSEATWGKFPSILTNDPDLSARFSVDYYSFPTTLLRPFPFFPRAPKLQELAAGLRTQIENLYEEYDNIILVCHSLGGLIAKRYLVEEVKAGRALRVDRLVLFAVPNNGADLVRAGQFLSRRHSQLAQLHKEADIIELLNEDWVHLGLQNDIMIKFIVGMQDKVVDRFSAAGYWANPDLETITGRGHINIVKPESEKDLAVKILKRFLLLDN